ncbi:MAG: T9SS type A sorting domain-containing protein [Fibrobacteres bacterium]|nr:T9SS type A sorting domain-containing protein [Fibrobacterota bacterium]
MTNRKIHLSVSIILFLGLYMPSFSSTNVWVQTDNTTTGGLIGSSIYADNIEANIYWGYRAAGGNTGNLATDKYDVEKYDAKTHSWHNEFGPPPQPIKTRFDADKYYTDFVTFGGKLRPKPPCPNWPGWLGYQACYVADSGKILYFYGRKTFTYDPITQTFANIPTDTSNHYINTPACVSMGSLCWDPINHEALLFGGGYIPIPQNSGWMWVDSKWFDPNFNSRLTWTFSMVTNKWSVVSTPYTGMAFAYIQMDSVYKICEKYCGLAGQHFFGHAEISPNNDAGQLSSKLTLFASELITQAANWSGQAGYERMQIDSARSLTNRVAFYLNQAAQELLQSDYDRAYQVSLDSAKWILWRAKERLAVAPEGRYYSRMVYAGHGKIVLFGGTGDKAWLYDTWIYDCSSKAWEHRYPKEYPTSLSQGISCMDYDAGQDVCVLVDGAGKLWSYSVLQNQWRAWDITLSLDGTSSFCFMDYNSKDSVHVLTMTGSCVYYMGTARKTYELKLNLSNAVEKSIVSPTCDYQWRSSVWENSRKQPPVDRNAWANTLANIPYNHLTDVSSQLPYKCIDRSYGVGTYDFERDQLIMWGGGHSAYLGTEVSHFDMATGRWYESYPPDYPPRPFGAIDGDGFPTLSGNPCAAHSYGLIGYDMRIKKMILGGIRYYDPDRKIWESDFKHYNSNLIYHWMLSTTNPDLGALEFRGGGTSYSEMAIYGMPNIEPGVYNQMGPTLSARNVEKQVPCYDSKRNRVFFYGVQSGSNTKYNETWVFNINDSSWEKLEPKVFDRNGNLISNDSLPNDGSWNMAYDPDHDVVVNFYPRIMYYDCAQNYWRLLETYSGQIHTVGYSLKQKMFVMSYFPSNSDGFTPTGIAFMRISQDSLPAPVSGEAEYKLTSSPMHIAISPNPANPMASIYFVGAEEDGLHIVNIEIFDIHGKLVKTVLDEKLTSGQHIVLLDGSKMSSGVYIVRYSCNKKTMQTKFTLLR